MSETTMAKEDVQTELLAATKLTPRLGESATDFTLRVAEKIHAKFKDDEWEALSEEAQTWVNDTILAKEDKSPLMLLTVPEVVSGGSSEENEEEVMANSEKDVGEGKKPTVKVSGKKPAGKKPTAKAATNGVAGRGRKGKFELDTKITVLAKENPKRPGSRAAKVFHLYKTGMSVQKALDAGLKWGDLNWDHNHGHIRIG